MMNNYYCILFRTTSIDHKARSNIKYCNNTGYLIIIIIVIALASAEWKFHRLSIIINQR